MLKLRDNVIPHRPGRNYPRRTKVGAYRKYKYIKLVPLISKWSGGDETREMFVYRVKLNSSPLSTSGEGQG
jgi:hypothetical protein